MFWTTVAHAMGTAPQGGDATTASGLASFAPLILMFAVFYFLLIRPQQKRAKEHKSMLEAIKRGDQVVTSGGLHGKVVEVRDDTLVVDLGETKVTVSRGFVSALVGPKTNGDDKKNKKDGKKEEPKKEVAKKAEPEAELLDK